ncbi:transposase [Clostridium sp.]|uniref:transposase n=1 Tax=Clostridium sp. TaxID=1506 RepID=UPI002FDC7BBD
MIQKQSWEITDEFWEEVKNLIPEKQRDPNKEYKRAAGAGRKPMESRKILEAIFYVLRTGIQWKALPKEKFGASSSIHRYFMAWCKAGVFENRQKISPNAFIELNDGIIDVIYNECDEYSLWNGYRLSAIDRTTLYNLQ